MAARKTASRETGSARKTTIAPVSLGCAKNAVDLQVRISKMLKEDCVLSTDPDRADIVIVNTCAFIESARQEAEAEIVRAIQLKRAGRFGKVIVTGCYPQRYPDAVSKFPGVDVWQGVPQGWEESSVPGFRFTGQAFAYLKIAEGCSHKCAYCAIPEIRGRFRSRPAQSIIEEAKALLDTGCRELVVVAQDPMLWRGKGYDESAKKEVQCRIADLLWALDSFDGDYWVRVLYSYPNEISGDFIYWMNNAKHAVKYIDVPLQHTVPEVLEKMNRRAAIEMTLSAADLLRELVPDVTLRTTIMTGFPGETPRRFTRLMSDLARMQFDHLGAFAYSPEKGTTGATLRPRPSRKIAVEREKAVMDLASRIWKVRSKRLLGKVFRALVVAPGVARLESQAPDVDGVTYIDTGSVGEFGKVCLDKVRGFDFVAHVV